MASSVSSDTSPPATLGRLKAGARLPTAMPTSSGKLPNASALVKAYALGLAMESGLAAALPLALAPLEARVVACAGAALAAGCLLAGVSQAVKAATRQPT